MQRILIIGASSAIAEAAARRWAQAGTRLFLVARDAARLAAIAADLQVRGAQAVESATLDADDVVAHAAVLDRAFGAWGGIDTVLIAYGTLPDQAACEQSVPLTLEAIHTNAVSVVAWMTAIASRLEIQGSGTVAVISSVAGDRGRASNAVYGSAKAMVSAYASGLRQRLQAKGIAVVTIKPGFVDTPMTAAFPKGILWAKPEALAPRIVAACTGPGRVVYLPWFWYPIMAVIRCLPERVFMKLRI